MRREYVIVVAVCFFGPLIVGAVFQFLFGIPFSIGVLCTIAALGGLIFVFPQKLVDWLDAHLKKEDGDGSENDNRL